MDRMASPAGIARSLTTRMNRNRSGTDSNKPSTSIGRAFSIKRQEKPAPRPEISLPVELLSATNPLAYNAPDIRAEASQSPAPGPISPASHQLTAASSSVSLRSEGSMPALSSAASTTFTFSGLSTPTDEMSDHQVHDLQNRLTSLPEADTEPVEDKIDLTSPTAPAIPTRAPSHTKRTHQALARQRSISRMRSEGSTTAESTPSLSSDGASRKSTSSSRHQSTHSSKEPAVARSSADMFSARTHGSGISAIDTNHPFGAELAKLTEVAEEFSPRRAKAESPQRPSTRSSDGSESKSSMPATPKGPAAPAPIKEAFRSKRHMEPTIWDEEQEYLNKNGLKMFSAEDYMAEIGSPYSSPFASVF